MLVNMKFMVSRVSVTGVDFSPNSSGLPFQYHSTSAPDYSLSTCSSYQKDKRSKHGNLKKTSLFGNGVALHINVLLIFWSLKG